MMNLKPTVEIVLDENVSLPQYETAGASGVDLRASHDITIPPNETRLVKTGIRVAVPRGFELQVRSRSGLALKHSVFVLNGVGTVDADYRGEVGVILHNAGFEDFVIESGDRIAQGVICPVIQADFVQVEVLSETKRGTGGFGSTGVK